MRSLTLLAAVLIAAPRPATAQNRRDDDSHWQKTLRDGQIVRVHNINGDIRVTPSSSNRVEIVGVRHGDGRDDDRLDLDVQEISDGIVVCVVRRDSDDECDARGFHSHSHGRDDWNHASMDLEIKLPSGVEISANSVSGSISVVGAQGNVRAGSVSGDIRLERLRAAAVRAQSVSGEVSATIETLSGQGELSFKTVSGNVTLELPRNFDADLSMSSVSGQLDSDFQMTLGGRMSRHQIEARIGRGGRDLQLSTVSGDVRLRMAK